VDGPHLVSDDVLRQAAVDDLHQEVVGDALAVMVDDLHQEVVGDVHPHAVEDALLRVVAGSADLLLVDVDHCYPLRMEEDDQLHRVEDLLGLLTQPSTQPVGPTIHQISFFAFRCRVPSVVENAPD
jgi:hypothetical protein